MGLFSSAAVVGDAGGVTLASVALAVVVALLDALVLDCVPVASLFAVFAGVHPATARARNA